MTTRCLLIEARRILTPDGAWTQDAAARDDDGQSVDEADDAAVCWCVDGAIVLATTGPSGCDAAAWMDATAALDDICPGGGVVDWDDAPGRTQAEVLALLDRTIEQEGRAWRRLLTRHARRR